MMVWETKYFADVAKAVNAPDFIIHQAKGIYSSLKEQRLLVGRTHSHGIIASLYAAGKMSNACPALALYDWIDCLKEKELIENFHCATRSSVVAKRVGKIYRVIMDKFHEKPVVCSNQPSTFIEPIIDLLDISDSVKERIRVKAKKLCDLVMERKLHLGRQPNVIAPAIIYIAYFTCNILSHEERRHNRKLTFTQRTLAQICNVTEVAIRNNYHFIWEKLKNEIDDLSDYQKTSVFRA